MSRQPAAPAPTLSEPEAWTAVVERNVSYDGRFVYAVSSTGVYCRPSCPSRRPAREKVTFYPLSRQAVAAGFRPCRRCRPDDPAFGTGAMVERAKGWIDARVDEPVSLAALARALGRSPSHVQRLFTRETGLSPREYHAARRVEVLKDRLRASDSVTDATYEAGYGSSSRVYERAKGQLGMTPAAYRRDGAGMRIAFDTVPSPLGAMLVAATARGVCAVRFGESADTLARQLRDEFSRADLERNPDLVAPWIAAVLRLIDGEAPDRPIPLDVRATAFQWRVWRALQQIPRGETRSYGELARSLGRARAFRAVAQACASNPVAVVVPCHRVVAAGGALGGYRWGVPRKEALLEAERHRDVPPQATRRRRVAAPASTP